MLTIHHRNFMHPGLASAVITPNDDAELPDVPRRILVGVAGDVIGWLEGDDLATAARTFKLPAGVHDLSFRKIKATLTTATNLIAIF